MAGPEYVLAAASIVLFCFVAAQGAINTTPTSTACGAADSDPKSDYQSCDGIISEDMIKDTANRNYNYYTDLQIGSTTCYGNALCEGHLSKDECERCLRATNTRRLALCTFRLGSDIKLVDCRMRIENYDFKWNPASV